MDQRVAILGRHRHDPVSRCLCFAAVPEHGFEKAAGAPVVQKQRVTADKRCQPDPPEGRRAPFPAIRAAFGPVIGQPLAHIMQKQIGMGPDQLEALLGPI